MSPIINQYRTKLIRKIRPLIQDSHPLALSRGIRLLAKNPPPRSHRTPLLGQPFDAHLLALSPVYRRSRSLFLEGKGLFLPLFISSARTLSSPHLLANEIEYTPIEQELIWSVTHPIEKHNTSHLLSLRTYVTSLFHEQSHRILWKLLPSAPTSPSALRRYLNFVESLVIILDMALADELGNDLARIFYLSGVIYDPGTEVKAILSNRRQYRNYLQAALFATYLNLEFYPPKDILRAICSLFPTLHDFAKRAVMRGTRLDRKFVTQTNPTWQKNHRDITREVLCRRDQEPLILSEHPMDNRLQYLWTEKWLDIMKI